MPKSNLILRCVYGTNDKHDRDNLLKVPSLYSLFNAGIDYDKTLEIINTKCKIAGGTKKPRKMKMCPKSIFWFRLFQLLLNNNFYSYNLRETNELPNSIQAALFGEADASIWLNAYFDNSYGTAIGGKKKSSPLVALNTLITKTNDYITKDDIKGVNLQNQLTSGLLAKYIIGIYDYKNVHSLKECDERNDPILIGFKDNWLLKDLNGRDRDTSVLSTSNDLLFKQLIIEFAKEFVNTIRSCLLLPNEEQILDTATAINDDSSELLAEPAGKRIGQDYYDGLSLFQKNNRFRYNSGKIDFQGRTTEIKTINK
ncbi:MAG: hypothetical protein IJ170_11130, partial [Ruminococcus sp.]|nr:hypothetical protein [Ruminococcus sp.]